MKEEKIEKSNKLDNWLKIVLVCAVALIAIALFMYVLRPSKTKSTFEVCYEECAKLGKPPENGKCDKDSYLGKRETDKGDFKKGDSWCFVGGGKCLNFCKE